MNKIGKRIVLEASKGVTFQMQEGAEEIVIKAMIEYIASTYSDNYKEPMIPEGYVHLKGDWDNGFVIQNKSDKSEFVWIPVGFLDSDATLDGETFAEKFGRMNFDNSDFSANDYHEEVNQELFESIKKYGGYYLSACHASKEKGKLVFKKGNMPWVNINYPDAKAAAASYAKGSKDVVSCITTGAAFDTMLRWIIKSGAKTKEEVVKDSTSWGNYWNAPNSPRKVMPTGSNENWCVCNICDIAGNVDEWTSETNSGSCRVLRGASYGSNGDAWPTAERIYRSHTNKYSDTSFRTVLYIK